MNILSARRLIIWDLILELKMGEIYLNFILNITMELSLTRDQILILFKQLYNKSNCFSRDWQSFLILFISFFFFFFIFLATWSLARKWNCREIWHASHCFAPNTCARTLTDLNYALFTERNWSICSGDHCILNVPMMISRLVLWILREETREWFVTVYVFLPFRISLRVQ